MDRSSRTTQSPMARPEKPNRIVSLIASSTEIICALGFERDLVGRSHECDYPPTVKSLPQLTEPKFKTEGTSLEIDGRVRELVREGLSVYRVFPELLARLDPTLIVTQIQCAVCAVSENDVKEAVCKIADSNPEIVSLNPMSLSDIWQDFRKVARALHAEDRGEALVESLTGRMDAISRKAQSTSAKVRVAYIEWISPLMSGGNWMPELVEKAGGINLFGKPGLHSPVMMWDEIVEADPDILFISPCGFDLARTELEMKSLLAAPHWHELRAVKTGRVILADGNQFFNRPGPRVVEALEVLAEVFYPDLFHSGHEGTAWKRFAALEVSAQK